MMLVQHTDKICLAAQLQLQAHWFILENNEKATLNINVPYQSKQIKILIVIIAEIHPFRGGNN